MKHTLATTLLLLHLTHSTALGQTRQSPHLTCSDILANARKLLTPKNMQKAISGIAILHILGCEAEALELEKEIRNIQRHDTDDISPT